MKEEDIPTLFRRGYIFRRGSMSRHRTAGTWTMEKTSRRVFIRCPYCTRILNVSHYDYTDAANADYIAKYAKSCSHCFCGFVFNFALLGYGKPDPKALKILKFIQKRMKQAKETNFYSMCGVSGEAITIGVTSGDHMKMLTVSGSGRGPYHLGASGLVYGKDEVKFETVELAIKRGIQAITKKP